MKAVIIKQPGKPIVANIKEPSLKPDYIKVKTVAVASNPTGFHHASGFAPNGHLLGVDCSGIFEEIGGECKNSDLKKGDRVFGLCHGDNTNDFQDGAFAEFIQVRDGVLANIPDNISFEVAATFGVAITSSGQSLYMNMKLPLPTAPTKTPFPILINGGSTSSGPMAIQFAKLSGLRVIATCNPSSFECATEQFSTTTHRPAVKTSVPIPIRPFTISTIICAEAFPPPESVSDDTQLKYIGTLPCDKIPRKGEKNVEAISFLAYTGFGKAFTKFGRDYPVMEGHYEQAVEFWKMSAGLIAEGKLKNHPVVLREGGLWGLLDGMMDVSEEKIHAGKLVFRIADTPSDEELERLEKGKSKGGKATKGPDLDKSNWMK